MFLFCPFEKLEIGVLSTEEDVKRAYKQKAMQCHSDKARQNGRKDVTQLDQLFQEISTAYEVLMNKTFRQKFRDTTNQSQTWMDYTEWKRESVKQWTLEQEKRIRKEEEQRAKRMDKEKERQKQREEAEDRIWKEQEEKLRMEKVRQEELRKSSMQLLVKKMEKVKRRENSDFVATTREVPATEINADQEENSFADDTRDNDCNLGVGNEMDRTKEDEQSCTNETSKKINILSKNKQLHKNKRTPLKRPVAYKLKKENSRNKKKQPSVTSEETRKVKSRETVSGKYSEIKKLLRKEKRCRELAEGRAQKLEEQLWLMTNILDGLKTENLRLKGYLENKIQPPTTSLKTDESSKRNLQMKKFLCQMCKINFSSASSLCRHRLSHRHPSKIRYHVCQICDKKFTRKDAHDKHIKTHA